MKKEARSPYQSMCAVSVKLHSGTDELDGTASGILINARQHLILTHASVLYPMVDKINTAKLNQLRKKGFMDQSFLPGKVKIEVVIPNGDEAIEKNESFNSKDKQIQISLLNGLNGSIQDRIEFSRYRGHMKGIFECRQLRQTLERLTPKDSWQFVEEPVTSNLSESKEQKKSLQNEEIYAYLLPCFVIIQLTNVNDLENNVFTDNISIRNGLENRQGDSVEICSTPFGLLSPEVFLNSQSRGIISNIAGPRGVLIMTDARCVPGCEGGGLFYCRGNDRLLTGIMIASLCWKNNEWVGLSMACSMSELIGSLNQLMVSNPTDCVQPVTGGSSFTEQLIEKIKRQITYVKVGHSWGTGVHIHPGVVVTCSHVLKGHNRGKVLTNRQTDGGEEGCQIVYKTPLNKQFDLAMLKTPKLDTATWIDGSSVQFGQVKEGEIVYVVGHAVFKPELGLSPTVTRGIVSKVIKVKGIPVMVQTTCAVHAGVSGGGVFNTRGHLVALVVCNSRDTVTGACYPHVNMCVPMETISPVINKYLETEDVTVLERLHIQNKYIHKLWSIGIEEETIAAVSSKL